MWGDTTIGNRNGIFVRRGRSKKKFASKGEVKDENRVCYELRVL